MSSNSIDQLSLEQRRQLWEKYEEIAMHFNDLILRLRTQALGGVTAIIALSGVAINFTAGPTTAEQWDVVFGTLLFLIASWVSIALLDLFYYHTLLLGAVDALLEIEANSEINLSRRVEQRFFKDRPIADSERIGWKSWFRERWWPLSFYAIGLSALIIAAIATKSVSQSMATKPDSKTLKVEATRVANERLQVAIEPAVPKE